MFDDLKAAFRQAVDNFNKELGRGNVAQDVDGLVKGMVDEVTEAKVVIEDLNRSLSTTRAEITKERGLGETCRRRERLALNVPDEETASIAAEHARRHEKRVEVLAGKAQALEAEIQMREQEVEQMVSQVKEARARRDELAATDRRTAARETVAGGDLFDELDRMADKIVSEERAADASSRFADLDFDSTDGRTSETQATTEEPDYDARLAALKRKMGL